ncbi:DUF58 domain-containing protein [Catenovulum sp. 2E275]|uniref:DUF58 domain-containing protein n=1 Tax=Catenovulum sp. 2E275 TaxID=2980497 RepID=UPI0021CE7CE6|nr:DUF58 domain-containing protein [Catenovulum sp. 2E275]MCU4676880.1 DUF58 domain-containing protein [Catenovulum sp. 2E275]
MKNVNSHLTWLNQLSANGIHAATHELLYYRGKTALLNLSPKQAQKAHLSGQYVSQHKGRGMEFDEVRHYQPGDDIRMIDWRVTARTGKTHTKLFREERERPVFILTDLSESMQFGSQLLYKSVQAAHLAALISWNVIKRGDRLGGLIFNHQSHKELKPKSRQSGVLHYIHALDMLSQPEHNNSTETKNSALNDKLDFSQACMRLRRLAKPGSKVILISDFIKLDESCVKQLTLLSQHCELQAYRILDPLELNLPQVGIRQSLKVQDQSQTGTLVLGDKRAAAAYHNEAQAFLNQQRQLLNKCRCSLTELSSALPLEEQL